MKFFQAISLLLLFSFMKVFDVFASGDTNLPVKTNKNKITTEFEDHIIGKKDLDISVESLRNIGTSAAESAPKFDDFLNSDDRAKVSEEQGRLSGIGENSLESEGRKERYSTDNAYFDDFETDYSRPGAMAHKKDAEDIASGTEKHFEKLTETLRKNGIDCKEVKNKPDIKDPYYIEIEKEEVKDTEYDPKFCEHLRTTYSCADTMTMTCLKRNWSIQWKDVGAEGTRTMDIDLGTIMSRGWWYPIFWKDDRTGIHMRGDPWVQKEVREEIAKRLKIKVGHIYEDIHISARGNGRPSYEVWDEHFAWGSYTVRYRYRGGEETCDKWSEERWDETCGLTSK